MDIEKTNCEDWTPITESKNKSTNQFIMGLSIENNNHKYDIRFFIDLCSIYETLFLGM